MTEQNTNTTSQADMIYQDPHSGIEDTRDEARSLPENGRPLSYSDRIERNNVLSGILNDFGPGSGNAEIHKTHGSLLTDDRQSNRYGVAGGSGRVIRDRKWAFALAVGLYDQVYSCRKDPQKFRATVSAEYDDFRKKYEGPENEAARMAKINELQRENLLLKDAAGKQTEDGK